MNTTRDDKNDAENNMDMLSRLTIRTYCGNHRGTSLEDAGFLEGDVRYLGRLSSLQLGRFYQLADTNHVLMRALTVLQDSATAQGENRIADWCVACLADERTRITRSLKGLHSICHILESHGCKVAVIKSLDHWPDLGSDLDLYTTANAHHVEEIMRRELGAQPVERSWGDRLANKWNYVVPGLSELVEIHVQWLGQTGEHVQLARRVIERRVRKLVEGYDFYVPAPEERIVISALQRVYRHFYFRLCDMIDMTQLLRNYPIDYNELHQAASLAGIWPGVATFLLLIQRYIEGYGGELRLPKEVTAADPAARVRFGSGFLRISKLTAAGLYGAQLIEAWRRRNTRAMIRLPLLPPLAVSALVAHRLTGNDKGIW